MGLMRSRPTVSLLLLMLSCRRGSPPAPSANDAAVSQPSFRQDCAVPVSSADPSRGASNAPVTIVVFSDFQCPFCAKLEPILEDVLLAYPANARLVWKNFPLAMHGAARPAAIAAQTVFAARGGDAFWRINGRIFRSPKDLDAYHLAQWSADLGVLPADRERLRASAEAKIDEDVSLGKKLRVQGTPAVFIDGERFTGRTVDEYRAKVDAHLAKAAALRAAGTAQDAIYCKLVEQHFKPDAPLDLVNEDHDDDVFDADVLRYVSIDARPIRGKVDAPATLVIFADFECPYCKQLAPRIDELRKHYGDRLRVVMRHDPSVGHTRAVPAAMLAIEAQKQKGVDAFWTAHDRLFASPDLSDSSLETIAKDLGLDVARAMTAIKTNAHRSVLDRDRAEAIFLGSTGTPTAYVNGKLLTSHDIDNMKKKIDEELREADALSKGGVKDLYATIIARGKGAPIELARPPDAPSYGAKSAKIDVHFFADFECMGCKFAMAKQPGGEPTKVGDAMDPESAAFIDAAEKFRDRARVVFRFLPSPRNARALPAAQLADSIFAKSGNDAFWQVARQLFLLPRVEPSTLDEIAKRWSAGEWATAPHPAIARDTALAKELAVRGTPTFFLAGRRLEGNHTRAEWEQLFAAVTAP